MLDKAFVTFHIQKDRRINLGYCVHKFRDCPSLKNRSADSIVEIEGPIVQRIPKCQHCCDRLANMSIGQLAETVMQRANTSMSVTN